MLHYSITHVKTWFTSLSRIFMHILNYLSYIQVNFERKMNVCTQDLIDGTSLNMYVAQKHTYRYAKFNQLWCSDAVGFVC
jgi:hypothetical protein